MLAQLPKFFLEGLVSVSLPCVLPLVPSYMAAIGAADAAHLDERRSPLRVLKASLPFTVGLTGVFVAFGLGVGALTSSGLLNQVTLDELAGIVLVVLGLSFMGLLPWPTRMVGGGLLLRARDSGSRVLLGAAFALCATPCIGVFLGAALADVARGQNIGRAGLGLAFYGLGLSVAFVAAGLAFMPALGALRWLRDHYRLLQAVGGAIIVAVGLLLFFGKDWWLQTAANHLLQALGLAD
jgi:cytochrome c-type biogenesis protein